MQLLSTTAAAAMLAAAALAAQTPRTQNVTASVFKDMVRYSTFASASYHGPCGRPPLGANTEVLHIEEKNTDTQASIFRDDAKKELILSFPGTQSGMDFFNDIDSALVDYKDSALKATCSGCKVHKGFYRAWKATAPLVKGNLTRALKQHPGYNITITGHSLGGSLASLAYAELSASGCAIMKAYTLGQSRTGNPAYATYIKSFSGASDSKVGKMYRLTHASDPFPDSFKTSDGYSHHSTEFWQQDDANNNTSAALTSRCYGDEPFDCNQSTTSNQDQADHSVYSNVKVGPESSVCS